MRHDKGFRRVLAALPLGWLLAACSGHTVDLGGGGDATDGEGGAVCDGAGIATGAFYVTDQSGLDALKGCREIRGSVQIAPFDADFTPLKELRRVDGSLQLGVFSGFISVDPPSVDGIVLGERPIQTAYADAPYRSLEGLESLEYVEGLAIFGSSAPSLEPLARLNTVKGGLSIQSCDALQDLSGLEQLRTVGSLFISYNPELVSLDGLVFPEPWGLDTLSLSDLPKLSNIDALSELGYVTESLGVYGTALETLDALSQLSSARFGVSVRDNPALIDISGLDNLQGVDVLQIENNDALRRVPSFRSLVSLEQFAVKANDALEVFDAEMPAFYHPYRFVNGARYEKEFEQIEVRDNPKLVRFAISPQMREINHIFVYRNDSLRELDLGGAVNIGMLSITQNQRLDTIAKQNLRTIRSLGVKRNPQLSMSAFDGVKTAETDARDNAP